ncbi:dCMP deaminase family protein [Spiroplasma endosymbiont of Crioceris asparagi]|uniref:deoxycytidylate deaminase n=1 Tax=Spiroplasma endosymbiont of Crioceris asparagi TaxID=3066286 RepID=UPI0030D0DA9D
MFAKKEKEKHSTIDWDTYFLAIVQLISMRSKDPNTKVGSVIVDDLNQVISTGYNGMARGVSDKDYSWSNDQSNGIENTKYPFVVHSEANAIVSARRDIRGTKLYTSLFPCNECSKLIIQSGIKEVIYSDNKYKNEVLTIASKRMLKDAGVKMIFKDPVKVIVETK